MKDIEEKAKSKERNLYTKYYETLKIKRNEVLLQSNGGKKISKNVYLILKELCKKKKYSKLKKYVVAEKDEYDNIKALLKNNEMQNVVVIELHSKIYCKKLAECRYLINNRTFPTYFIKKEGQIYLNIWKSKNIDKQGRNDKESRYTLGNTQRNFLMSDYIVSPSETALKNTREGFMLNNLYKGKYIISESFKKEINMLCKFIFKQQKNENIKIINGEDYSNHKKNVLIFGGNLAKNGITSALKALIYNVDIQKYNYILVFAKSRIEENKDIIDDFKCIDYMPMHGGKIMTKFEQFLDDIYFNKNISNKLINKKLEKVYRRDLKRLYPNLKFEYAIHYCGYERKIMKLYQYINAKRILYLHSDMKQEIKNKGNIHEVSFKSALDNYDKIVTVRETSKNEIINYYPKIDKNKLVTVHNLNNIDLILKMSEQEITFENETYCNISIDNLKEILNNNNAIKYINIARFSKEKGQERLINAFSKYQKKHRDSYLILIGGYGKEFDKIKDLVSKKDNIIIIRSINNPYAILKKCNLFILSSFYEGLPLTIMEALILNKPVISTDITGPAEFLKQGYGHIVENSEEGILHGMESYINGNINNIKRFDAYEFNKKALSEFEQIIN